MDKIPTWSLELCVEYKLQDKQRISKWCVCDPDFKFNQLVCRFKNWIATGITFFSVTDKGRLKDFQSLKEEYALEKEDFL